MHVEDQLEENNIVVCIKEHSSIPMTLAEVNDIQSSRRTLDYIYTEMRWISSRDDEIIKNKNISIAFNNAALCINSCTLCSIFQSKETNWTRSWFVPDTCNKGEMTTEKSREGKQ